MTSLQSAASVLDRNCASWQGRSTSYPPSVAKLSGCAESIGYRKNKWPRALESTEKTVEKHLMKGMRLLTEALLGSKVSGTSEDESEESGQRRGQQND